jgi:hypothetical protein
MSYINIQKDINMLLLNKQQFDIFKTTKIYIIYMDVYASVPP